MGSFATIAKQVLMTRNPIRFLIFFVCGMLALHSYGRPLATDTLSPIASNPVDTTALRLLMYNEVFTENWVNDVAFVYDNVRAEDLPESVNIPLIQPGDAFTPTWYGKISSGYKYRWGRQHHGIDIGLKTGDPVVAAWDGVVRYAQWNKSGYGNCVIIRHKNGLETVYGHLSKIQVTPNQYVRSGDTIGLGGSTGRSTGPHLHFEIRYKDFSIDPELVVDYNTLRLRMDTFTFLRSNVRKNRYENNVKSATTQPDSSGTTYHSTIDTLYQRIDPADSIKTLGPTAAAQSIASEKSISGSTNKKIAARKPPAKKSLKTYTIKKGDTYSSISKKTGVSIATLRKLNPKQKETRLMPGNVLRIR